jgi:hypothetical protein
MYAVELTSLTNKPMKAVAVTSSHVINQACGHEKANASNRGILTGVLEVLVDASEALLSPFLHISKRLV